jgi:predicted nucleotidyltransferase component of viral defense system
MLPLRDITDWAPHARWATEAQTEQDLLITLAVVAIFADSFLSGQVAMRGGTVLHKLHLAPAVRYSEDIDLVAIGDRPRGHIVRALRRVLDPIMGGPPARSVVERIKLAVRNSAKPNEVARLTYEYAPTVMPPPVAALKIEVNLTERTPVYQVVRLPYSPALPSGARTVQVVSYDVNEMLGTKLRALLQRDHGRDLFDLAHAWTHCATPGHPHPIDAAAVARAFAVYMAGENAVVSRVQFEASLARKLELARFRADLRDVLATDASYDVDRAAHLVRAHYLSHLP